MTPERIAKLRRLAEEATKAGPWPFSVTRCCQAIPELLDEIEATQHAASVFCEAHIADVNDDDVQVCPCCEAVNQSDRADRLAEQLEVAKEFSQIASDACNNLRAERDRLAAQLQESESANEAFRCELGRVAPTEYRCVKPNGWLCGLGYGHAGGCMPVNHPHPLGSD